MKRHRKELDVNKASPRVRWYVEEIDRAAELLADFRPRMNRDEASGRPDLT